jgi:lysozyme
MKKQTCLLGVVLFISFFLSCKHQEKKVDQYHKSPTIKESLTPFVYGIDISHRQNNKIDCISKALDSLSFVICKATEGVTYTDEHATLIKVLQQASEENLSKAQLVDNIKAL